MMQFFCCVQQGKRAGSSNTEQTAFLAQQKVKVSHTVEHSKKSCKYGQEPLVLLLLQHTPPISFLYFL